MYFIMFITVPLVLGVWVWKNWCKKDVKTFYFPSNDVDKV